MLSATGLNPPIPAGRLPAHFCSCKARLRAAPARVVVAAPPRHDKGLFFFNFMQGVLHGEGGGLARAGMQDDFVLHGEGGGCSKACKRKMLL